MAKARSRVEVGELLERVERLRPLIAAGRDKAEQAGRLDAEVISALREERLYSMLLPRELGGLGTDPATALLVTEALAGIDSAVAWNVNQAGAGVFFAARLGPVGADRIFSGRDAPPVFAGAAFPPCSGIVTDDGIRVSGRVRFVSGCADADWLFVLALVARAESEPEPTGEAPPPDMRVAFVPRQDVTALDTWHVMGMRGTGSADIVLDDVLVPEELTASMLLPTEPSERAPASLALFPWPLLHGEAVVSLGIARASLESAASLATTKVPANAAQPTSTRELTQANLAKARALIESARAYLDTTLAHAIQATETGGSIPLDVKVSLQLAVCTAAESGARAVELVYEALGTSAFFEDTRIERDLRDVRVLTQHGTKSAARYVSAGRVMLGLPPDTGTLR